MFLFYFRQAAVGSQALDYGKSMQKDDLFKKYANQVKYIFILLNMVFLFPFQS